VTALGPLTATKGKLDVIADIDIGYPESLDEDLIRTLRENFYKERFPSDRRIY
jgi:hypothetical protein